MRRLVPLSLVAALAACPTYDAEPYLATDKGLMDADEWAKYGPEQAAAVAIGREFGEHGPTPAAEHARGLASVDSVTVDSLGHRLVVHFKSGWDAQVTPIRDGGPSGGGAAGH